MQSAQKRCMQSAIVMVSSMAFMQIGHIRSTSISFRGSRTWPTHDKSSLAVRDNVSVRSYPPRGISVSGSRRSQRLEARCLDVQVELHPGV